MRTLVSITFAILVANCCCGWSTPVKVFEEDGIATSLYVDPLTNITHFAYSLKQTKSLDSQDIYYRAMYPNGTFTAQYMFDPTAPFYRCSIVGTGDGKTLHITAFGPRRSFDGHCSEAGTDYCFDIFFTDSADNGRNWTDWRRVERDDMEDRTRRLGETTLYVKETGRIYVFYTVGSYETLNAIAFVTKSRDSAVFSRERIVLKRGPSYINAGVSAAYTLINGKPVLHVLWEEPTNLFYSSSRDNGISWSNPRVLRTNVSGETLVIPVPRLFSNPQVDPTRLFMTYTDWNKTIRLMVSNDEGKTFAEVCNLTKPGQQGRIAVLDYAGTSEKNMVFISHCSEETTSAITFFAYDVKHGVVKEIDQPFYDYSRLMSPWITAELDGEGENFHIIMFTSYYSSGIVGGLISTLNYPAK